MRIASCFSVNQKKKKLLPARYARAMVAMKLAGEINQYLTRPKTHSTRGTHP